MLQGFDSTFANNILGISIANYVLDYIQKEEIIEKVNNTGKLFLSELRLLEQFNFIKAISGTGMAFSYRVESQSVSINNAQLVNYIRKIAFDNHLIIQAAGIKGDYMKISPSFLISKEEIKLIIDRLIKVMLIVSET